MKKDKQEREIRPVEKSPIWTSQEEVIRAVARQMLQTEIEMEVSDFLNQSSKKEGGRSVVVKWIFARKGNFNRDRTD